jgi:hypothetical protein
VVPGGRIVLARAAAARWRALVAELQELGDGVVGFDELLQPVVGGGRCCLELVRP